MRNLYFPQQNLRRSSSSILAAREIPQYRSSGRGPRRDTRIRAVTSIDAEPPDQDERRGTARTLLCRRTGKSRDQTLEPTPAIPFPVTWNRWSDAFTHRDRRPDHFGGQPGGRMRRALSVTVARSAPGTKPPSRQARGEAFPVGRLSSRPCSREQAHRPQRRHRGSGECWRLDAHHPFRGNEPVLSRDSQPSW
jgi:hypothetical protein